MSMMKEFCSTPQPGTFFLHALKPVENITVGWAQVLPTLIRDPNELRACAILCANSNVKGFFHECKVSLTDDKMYVKLQLIRKGSTQHVAIDDIEDVSHALPTQFGIEAVGNPLCGLRLTLLGAERTVVLYAQTPSERVQWNDWLRQVVERRRKKITLRPAYNAQLAAGATLGNESEVEKKNKRLAQGEYDRGDYQLPGAITPISGTAVSFEAARGFDLPVEIPTFFPDGRTEDDPEGKRLKSFSPSGSPRRWQVDDEELERTAKEREERDQVERRRQLHLQDEPDFPDDPSTMAAAVLPPLHSHEAQPSRRHLAWRYGEECLDIFSDCTPEQLELMRKLAQLRCPGRWDEMGQAHPAVADIDSDDDDAVASLRVVKAEVDTGVRRIKTAKEILGGLDTSAANSSGTGKADVAEPVVIVLSDDDEEGAGSSRPPPATSGFRRKNPNAVHPLDQPLPWVPLQSGGVNVEGQMELLRRVASLRLDGTTVETDKLLNQPFKEQPFLPKGIPTSEVKDHWRSQYDKARGEIQTMKKTLAKRLGVKRMATGEDPRKPDYAKKVAVESYEKHIQGPKGKDVLQVADEKMAEEEKQRQERLRRERDRQQQGKSKGKIGELAGDVSAFADFLW